MVATHGGLPVTGREIRDPLQLVREEAAILDLCGAGDMRIIGIQGAVVTAAAGRMGVVDLIGHMTAEAKGHMGAGPIGDTLLTGRTSRTAVGGLGMSEGLEGVGDLLGGDVYVLLAA